MSMFTNPGRKALAVLVSAIVLASAVTASSSASAHQWRPRLNGFGLGAAIVGGIAIGALVASEESNCYVIHRTAVDDYGNEYVRRVRVCE